MSHLTELMAVGLNMLREGRSLPQWKLLVLHAQRKIDMTDPKSLFLSRMI